MTRRNNSMRGSHMDLTGSASAAGDGPGVGRTVGCVRGKQVWRKRHFSYTQVMPRSMRARQSCKQSYHSESLPSDIRPQDYSVVFV